MKYEEAIKRNFAFYVNKGVISEDKALSHELRLLELYARQLQQNILFALSKNNPNKIPNIKIGGKDITIDKSSIMVDAYEIVMPKVFLEEFGLDKKNGMIINGHMPVKIKKGEEPIKAGGKQIIIDGGISKAYQKVTGIAGYTLISNSHGTKLVAHEVFQTKEKAISEDIDIHHSTTIVKSYKDNLLIKDTYNGKKIQRQIDEIKELVKAYRLGLITSK